MILLDTHIWIRWILNDNPLSQTIIDIIESSDAELAVSAISTWELVLLEKRKRIELPLPVDEWLEEALLGSGVQSLPISSEIAFLAGSLPSRASQRPCR
ncbi:MAG: type II toxin-antitoxin system VapC family toxin [Methylococcaceae bacterium]|nr:type II toxin-antitoxin system VapC family toxin [Methylococcaceae bacterium]